MMPRERKTTISDRAYNRGRQIEWIKSDWYCIDCGKQDVWQTVDEGSDYYHECSAKCHSCGASICCVGKVTD